MRSSKRPNTLLLAFLIALAAALICWIIFMVVSPGEGGDKPAPSASAAASTAPDASPSAAPTATPAPTPTPMPTPAPTPTPVPTPTLPIPVGDEIFKGMLFFGDSLAEGLRLSKSTGEAKFIAEKSTNTISAKKKVDLVAAEKPDRVMIYLGINDITYMTDDKYIGNYATLLEMLKQALPDAHFYIQSLLPVTKAFSDKRAPNITNERLVRLNGRLEELAEATDRVWYIDNSEPFRNEEGALDDQWSSDGLHMNFSRYKLWSQSIKDWFSYHPEPDMPFPTPDPTEAPAQ